MRSSRRKFPRLLTVVVVASSALVATATSAAADQDSWGAVVPGEYIVELKPEGTAAGVAAAAGSTAPPELLQAGSRYVRLILDPTADPAATVAALLNTPGVEQAQPNFVTGSSDYLGAKRKFFGDLGVAAVSTSPAGYTVSQPALGNAGLPGGTTASTVRVAVLDTGVDMTHPRLVNRLQAGGRDFVDKDTIPAEVANGLDDNGNGFVDEAYGHGTYVAGLVALVAPGARILPIRVLDSDGRGSTWTVMQGIAWAVGRGAQIINLSLGGSGSGPVAEGQMKSVVEGGTIVVAAAGNDATEAPMYPAASDGVLSVTSFNGTTGSAATFANRGSWIDVAAPGVNVVSLYPGGRFATWGGSSAAAPVVAGAMAMIEKARPGGAVDDLVDHLTSTSNPNGVDGLSSYGRVNIAAAVQRALQS